MEVPTTPSEAHKRRSRAASRSHLTRSSPIRLGMSENSSPERQQLSPSMSTTQLVLPAPTVLSPNNILFKNTSGPGAGPSPMSFFSPRPPYMPVFIVPLPPNDSTVTANTETVVQPRPQAKTKKKLGRKIVRQLLESILQKLPIISENIAVEAVEVKSANTKRIKDIKIGRNRSIAVQVLSKHPCNRKMLSGEEEEYSSCKSSESTCPDCERSCMWAGSVRALRESHVRLVLQQLRQLQDIERLNRALRWERVE